MSTRIRYIERQPSKSVSIEKVFREIASKLPPRFKCDFDQLPFSSKVYNIALNLLFFRTKATDIYHITGHVHFIALRLPVDCTVLTIHDVRFLYDHSGLKRFILKKLFLDLPVRRLRYITTISSTVKDEIVRHTSCDPERIRVLDVPLLSHFEPQDLVEFNSAKPRILQIGTMENKNIPNLAKALKGVSCRLVIVGDLTDSQRHVLEENEIDLECLADLSDNEMQDQYSKADVIAYCSTYEGFGLPIIEAQAVGKPAVTSDLSPMKETAGDGAYLVDPFDVESIRAGILSVINDEPRRLKIVEAGFKNAKRFEPAFVAAQYEKLYDEIHSKSDSL